MDRDYLTMGTAVTAPIRLGSWRDYIRQHVIWIDENRADLPIYKGIRKVYLRENLRVSIELQKRRLAQKKNAA
jgi:hypothetical protein